LTRQKIRSFRKGAESGLNREICGLLGRNRDRSIDRIP
jgi:hypothetical protein